MSTATAGTSKELQCTKHFNKRSKIHPSILLNLNQKRWNWQ